MCVCKCDRKRGRDTKFIPTFAHGLSLSLSMSVGER